MPSRRRYVNWQPNTSVRYFLYAAWAGIFYLILFWFNAHVYVKPLLSVQLVLCALIFPSVFKRYLPLLRDQRFPEIGEFLRKNLIREESFSEGGKKCSACGSKTGFALILGSAVGKDLEPRKKKVLCRKEGLAEWRKWLEQFPGVVVFSEPRIKRASGSFFYEPDDLKIHEYSSSDKTAVEDLLGRMKPGSIGWLPNETIGICQDPPLLKKKIKPEEITLEEWFSRLDRIFFEAERKLGKMEYWVTEPRGKSGIYIWDGEV
ncbi:MAG: hypothetical protein Q7J69_06895 [Candidatus Omnitrophota bacterium]|nr:hypothetical protein [Candidatus Omnitrophota bacterium]